MGAQAVGAISHLATVTAKPVPTKGGGRFERGTIRFVAMHKGGRAGLFYLDDGQAIRRVALPLATAALTLDLSL